MTVESWVDAGILSVQADNVVSLVYIVPYRGLHIAHDNPQDSEGELPANVVMGIGSSSHFLAESTIRRRARLTLDVGTGCGIQALLAAAHSDRVYAVDRNPRAIMLGRFNTHLNNIDNVEFLEGSTFDPVRDKRFDLIVSNPPFVISPETRLQYRDSGMQGDAFCRQLVREAPDLLQDGGHFQAVCNWAQYAGSAWHEQIAEWFNGSGCDVWVIRGEEMSPSEYTRFWNRTTSNPTQFGKIYREWMDDLEGEKIAAISIGLISMRRSSSRRKCIRIQESPKKTIGPFGNDILSGFESFDILESLRDENALAQARLQIASDVRLHQVLEPGREGWQLVKAELCHTTGLGFCGDIDARTATMLSQFDGNRSTSEVIQRIAKNWNVSYESIAAAHFKVLRNLILHGFILTAP